MKRFVGTVIALAAAASGLVASGAAQAAVTPADGATYDAGTEFTFPCISPTPRPDAHIVISSLERADPRVPRTEGFGVYPAFSSGWANPNPAKPPPPGVWPAITQVGSNFYLGVGPNSQTWACTPKDAHADGTEVPEPSFTLGTPGYYHLVELDVTEHHQPIQPPPFPPDPATCSDDIGGAAYLS